MHGNYRIPADNPFIGYTLWHGITIDHATVRTEIYATGLRNPFRWSFDPPKGRMFIGDVGQKAYEEITLVSKGDDLGWSWREGLHPFVSPPAPTSPPAASNPSDPPGTGFSPLEPIYEYLDVNCAQCHQPGGATIGNWDARSMDPTDSANLINGLLVNPGGDPANRWCVPGDTGHSMVLKRISGSDGQRMPPLASTERDLVSESLITDWINSALPNRQSFAQWQLTHFSSTSDPDAQPSQNPDGDGQNNDLEFLIGGNPIVNDPPYAPQAGADETMFSLTFTHPANRSALIETSDDFQNWSLWDTADNDRFYPSATQQRTLTGPLDTPKRFFRLKLSAP